MFLDEAVDVGINALFKIYIYFIFAQNDILFYHFVYAKQ